MLLVTWYDGFDSWLTSRKPHLGVGIVSERPKLHSAIVMAFMGVNVVATAALMRPGLLGLTQ